MNNLSYDNFIKSRTYLMSHGRKLDQHLFEYKFENGEKKNVLEELSSYQNQDGGFGNGLEPDLRSNVSSVISTSHGFKILRDLEASKEEVIVQKAVDYLIKNYDNKRGIWSIVPKGIEDSPHPWWWNYNDLEKNFNGFLINPRAAIIGHLYHYSELVSPDFLITLGNELVAYLQEKKDNLGMYDFLCCLSLVDSDNLPKSIRTEIVDKLKCDLPKSMELEQDKWAYFCLSPLVVAPTPESTLRMYIRDEDIESNLDAEISNQLPDGSWKLAWSWAEVDQEEWNKAKKEWKGSKIVTKLESLYAYDRIEMG